MDALDLLPVDSLTAPGGSGWLCLGRAPLHLEPLPLDPLLVGLAGALADALVGGRPMGVRLGAGYRAALTADGPTGLSVSVRRPHGPTVLRRQPLDRVSTREWLLRALSLLAAARPEGARQRVALEDAAARLRACGPAQPRPASTPAPRPVPLELAPVRLAPHQVRPVLASWLDVLEAALASPEQPVVPRRILLEPPDVALRVQRLGRALERQVVDADGLGLSSTVRASVRSLAAAAPGLVSRQAGLAPAAQAELLRRAERLARWAAALQPGRTPSPGSGAPLPPSAGVGGGPRLPVEGLFHLAYRRRWRVPARGLQHASLVGDEVHLTDADGLAAVDRATGALRWRAPGWRGLGPMTHGLALDGHARVSRRDGQTAWSRSDLTPPRRVGRLPSGDWLLTHDDGLEVLDPATGARRWAAEPVRGRLLGACWAAGWVWALGEDRLLRQWGADGGLAKARIPLSGQPVFGPAGDLRQVWALYEGHGRHTLAAFGADGEQRWARRLREAPLDRPRRLGALLAVPTGDPAAPRLLALDPATGDVVWTAPLPGGPSPPRLSAAGSLVLAKALDGRTVALQADDGAPVWALPADDPDGLVTHTPPPLLCRGIAIIAAGTVRAVDPASGRVVHTLDSGGLLPDRIHVWPDGAVLISEREGAALFTLDGHLALVR